jgi:hypothetical protein
MNMQKIIPSFILDFFRFRLQGAKIAVALEKGGRIRLRMPGGYIREGAQPIIENGVPIAWSVNDFVMHFQIVTNMKLILKNNSKFFAYNIEMLNADKIFAEFKPLNKLTSLAPNESIEIEVKFIQHKYALSGLEADELPNIPEDLQNNILVLQYANEANKKLFTKFWVSEDKTYNEFSF